jgi:hypothetical protein
MQFKVELGVFADGDVMPQLYLGERDVPDIDSVCEGCSYEAEGRHYFEKVVELCDDMRNVAGAAWEDCFWTCHYDVLVEMQSCTMCDGEFLPDDCETTCSQCRARGY